MRPLPQAQKLRGAKKLNKMQDILMLYFKKSKLVQKFRDTQKYQNFKLRQDHSS